MKKLFIGIFTVMLAVSFIACKPSSGTDGDQNPAPTYIGTKAPTEAKAVGDIVFNDGSATPYTSGMTFTDAQKNAAIALIFYKGTGLNSDVNGVADTTTSRTLGVGLKHKTTDRWCSEDANAHSVNIDTIQCPASGSNGTYTFTGDKNGSDNLEQIGIFLTNNSSTDDTSTAANYPAFYFGKNYKGESGSNVSGTVYESGWYLPSIAELFQIYVNGMGTNKVFDIGAASEALGGDTFTTQNFGAFWSSSQLSSTATKAYFILINDGMCGDYQKSHQFEAVCCIREF